MKKRQLPKSESQRPDSANTTANRFTGTDNPRHQRALQALLTRSQPREHLDRIAGASNSPELIAELRRRGLDIPCDRVPVIDRDGLEVKRGVYHLSAADRRKIHAWLLRRRHSGFAHPHLVGLLVVAVPTLVTLLAAFLGGV